MKLSAETHLRLTAWVAFLIPALALWLPSGFGYGTALLYVGALWGTSWWLGERLPAGAHWLLLAFAAMALVWLSGSDWSKGAGVLNKPLRYVLALPALLYLLRFPPALRWLLAGLVAGAATGGLRALYDVGFLGLERPWITGEKSANAIQLGNLSGLLGLMCWLQLMVYWPRWRWSQRTLVGLACALGLLGSLLSQTRGGWLALALCGPVLLWLLALRVSARRTLAGVALLAVVVAAGSWKMAPQLQQRYEVAVSEVNAYEASGAAHNSVGHRLDHWKLAWNMGRDRPLTGWGETGYVAEKTRRVAAGQASDAVLLYGHAHQEVLDMFAKRGALGVAGLGALYLVPLALFWPGRRRMARLARSPGYDDVACLRLMGVAFVLAHMGFGLTQVFFAHYNGVVIYLDGVSLLFAALVAAGAAARQTTGPVPAPGEPSLDQQQKTASALAG